MVTSAHSMPTAASTHNSTGSPPAADATSRRTRSTLIVGRTAAGQSTMRMPVAEVDHGSDTATPTASQSASRANAWGSKILARRAAVMLGIGAHEIASRGRLGVVAKRGQAA